MTREEALAHAHVMAATSATMNEYAARLGVNRSTLVSRCFRAGVRLGAAARAYRVRLIYARVDRERITVSRAACDAGFSSTTAFFRARRTVRAWPEWAMTETAHPGVTGAAA